jgi:hypothetical protein
MNRAVVMLGWAVVGVAWLAGGCGPAARTETFDIDVRNATTQPVTLSLAKDGPPFEAVWASPEDAALISAKYREQWVGGDTGLGQVVGPGRTASIRNLSGRFTERARGYVRAYAGDLSMSMSGMMARGPDSPGRVDVPLTPGANKIVIEQDAGRVVARPDR